MICIVEMGIQATSVRAVATRAGVSNGLIRHHFQSKANLIAAAYRRTMALISESALQELASETGTPHERLRRFVVATLERPATEFRMLSLWGTFVSQSRVDPQMAAVRDSSYLVLRQATEPLIAEVLRAEGNTPSPEDIVDSSVLVHAVLDGLWIEACLDETKIGVDKIILLALEAVEKILKIKL